jgi:hypothetical protein
MKMSTKAYDFFIMDKNKLISYLIYSKRIITLYLIAKIKNSPELSSIFTAKDISSSLETFNKYLPEITNVMRSRFRTINKDELNLTAGVSIWFWNNSVVVKVYNCDDKLASLMKQPEYATDFSYWDNTDKPDEIGEKEWERRRKFYRDVIDEIPLISYVPYDFLSNNAEEAVIELKREYYEFEKKKEGDEQLGIETKKAIWS